jgi:hypothetical protein
MGLQDVRAYFLIQGHGGEGQLFESTPRRNAETRKGTICQGTIDYSFDDVEIMRR